MTEKPSGDQGPGESADQGHPCHQQHGHADQGHDHPDHAGGGGHGGHAEESVGGIFGCPMHPDVRQARSGVCPECGMALEPLVALGVGVLLVTRVPLIRTLTSAPSSPR